MKKILLFVLSFMLILTGSITSMSAVNLSSNTEVLSDDNSEYVVKNIDTEATFISIMSDASTYDNKNIKIVLEKDLDFTNYEMSAIFASLRCFQGHFDGQGYTISNITLSSNMLYYGLIPYAQNATIENLKISGNVNFLFDEENTNPIYAGVLLGYGENVTIRNCELYNVKVETPIDLDPEEPVTEITTYSENENHDDEVDPQVEEEKEFVSTDLQIYSNITFGGIAGKLISSVTEGQPNAKSVVSDSISYYDFNVYVNRESRIVMGGLVGSLSSGSELKNCLSFGDINVYNNVTTKVEYVYNQYYGGIAGEIEGTNTYLLNTCYGGQIIFNENVDKDCYKGSIVGNLNCPQADRYFNVNFSYWTQGNMSYYGAGYAVSSNKLSQVAMINRDFLANVENFDTKELGFNFENIWSMIDSELHLQNFQQYTFSFNSTLDVGRIIESATLKVEGDTESEGATQLTVKYGINVVISIKYTEDNVGYYRLSNIMLNGNTLESDYYTANPTEDEGGLITGYDIIIPANDATDGTYSFSLSANQYNCVVEISQEAIEKSQGGVKVVGASSSTSSMNLSFSATNRNMSITAVGNGIYSFSHWELFYRTENGEFLDEPTSISTDLSQSIVLNIDYGSMPFDREFKLVANFTDEEAVLVSIDASGMDNIKSITLASAVYEGEPIAVSPTSTSVILEIVTLKNYTMDIDAFVSYVQRLYGDNSTDTLIVSDPVTNEEGETTYSYRLNMRYITEINDNKLTLSVQVVNDGGNMDDGMLWVYIVVPIVAVIIIGVVIFIIVRRRKYGGGGRGGKGGSSGSEKKKPASYKDYYV